MASLNDENLRDDLSSTESGKGASLVALEQGGNVQQSINIVMPEWYGAKGNGLDDDSSAFTQAANTGKNLYLTSGKKYLLTSPCALPFIANYEDGERKTVFGNGAKLITKGAYSPFNQYTDETKSSLSAIVYGWNFFDLNIEGFANKDSSYDLVNGAHGISFGFGKAYNINGLGLCNVIRAYGKTIAKHIYGDELRNALYSCYPYPKNTSIGNNKLFNACVNWCSGDGLVLKGSDIYVDGFHYKYAGCITANNNDGANATRGVAISAGADGVPASSVTINNISGEFYGAGSLNLNASDVTISGGINLGSYYTENFKAELSSAAVWLNVTNAMIGDIKCENIFTGLGINPGCSDFYISSFSAKSKYNVSKHPFFSIGDSVDTKITRGFIGNINLFGESAINNDVYINTAGVIIDSIHISQMNNQEGGDSVTIAKAATINNITLISTTSAATNNILNFLAAAKVQNIYIERVFGTAITVSNDIVPKLDRVYLFNKQGTKAPIIINGNGSASHQWGLVTITGPSVASPRISGSLIMEGYSGNEWKRAVDTVSASVSYPQKQTFTLT
ncbi:TPA: hypothetical protein ACW71V_004094 [Klebsiella aerogenes]|jgi:hypothetical protein|uniref:hypothetical protein n=1 Tax=Klebsiella aerogenes TaxID=548 RepID=UPI0004516778|nr:hypothetical protein [Klebsiella aerogenes]EIV6705555.1 hypothetical protein [Klebsiella aerogenes]EKU8837619.1 hypothetical protein [Klebsiella aerogenes]EKV6366972.1 hypothetical protein [Klebsiella aerogenes]EKW2819255.1 hypothetical protein [Klebsiella aerogenes]EKW3882440.1 hypothetical protein [Klebsiella aerogenes]